VTGLILILCGTNLLAQEWQTDTLQIAPGDSTLFLSRRFILPESLTIDNADSVTLDPLSGQVLFHAVRPDSVVLIVKYQCLPLDLPLNNIVNPPPRIYSAKEAGQTLSTPVPASKTNYSSEYNDFLKSGTLYRGITLGSQSGLSLQSGLNLELQGKIAEDITIVGTLTDQNIPIQAEGNTQTLDEIDKVFIKVSLPHEQITFGDYEVALRSGTLGNYDRKLQGIFVESNRKTVSNALSGAVTKGQYNNNYFLGEEGNQGPYQLTGRGGATAIIVLAGTEKVWIDGRLLTRGESSDYVIDYSTGEITFTARQIITAESRISVDFQYSDLIYQKNIYLARNSTELLDRKLKISAAVIAETDDKDNPIELTLSKADQKLLKTLGDDASNAYQSTITADSAGSYILSDSILVYVGSGSGTHTATFYNIGENGSYKKVYDGDLTYFKWVDKNDPNTANSEINEAIYLPSKPLKFARGQKLYHVSGEWHPATNLYLQAEIAHSDLDQNLFSPLDDGDNTGNAVNLETKLIVPLATAGRFTVSGRLKQEDWNYNPIDRNQAVEYRRKWDLPSDSTNGERYYEGAVQYALNNTLIINTEGGTYSRGDFNSGRIAASASLRYKWLETCEISEERIQREQTAADNVNWTRRALRLTTRIKSLRPFTTMNYELRDGDTTVADNFRFLEQIYGVGSSGKGRLRWQIQTTMRRDDAADSNKTWIKSTFARNLGLNGQILDWHSFSAQWDYTHRIKQYYARNSADVSVDLLDLSLKMEPRKLPYRWEATLKVEREQSVKKEYRYYYVGDGLGNFIYDSTYADYVPDVQGDYILRIISSSIREPVTSINDGLRFQFNGADLKNPHLQKFLKRISTLTDIRLQQEISNPDGIFSYLNTMIGQVDTNWVNYARSIQQDINLRSLEHGGDLRFRIYISDQVTQTDVRGQEKTGTDEWSLRYRGRLFGKTSIESESSVKVYLRESEINVLRNRDICSYREKMTVSNFIDRIHLIGAEINLAQDSQKGSDPVKSLLTAIRMNYERKITGKGRWKLFLELDKVAVTPKGESIPYEMSNAKKEGLTIGWGTTFEYRIGANLSIRANYEGWNEPDRAVYHIGSCEMRVTF